MSADSIDTSYAFSPPLPKFQCWWVCKEFRLELFAWTLNEGGVGAETLPRAATLKFGGGAWAQKHCPVLLNLFRQPTQQRSFMHADIRSKQSPSSIFLLISRFVLFARQDAVRYWDVKESSTTSPPIADHFHMVVGVRTARAASGKPGVS